MRKLVYLFVVCLMLTSACKKKEVDGGQVKGLTINDFFPVSGKDSTIVTINGANFSAAANLNLITIGDFSTTPTTASVNKLVFVIPPGIPLGTYPISVKVNGVTVIASAKFTVTQTSGGSGIVSTAKLPIDAAIVNKSFMDWGKAGVHPRLLFSTTDISRIKSLALTDAFAKPTYDNIISRANTILSSPLLTYGLDGARLRINNIHTFSNDQVPFLVLAYQFTKDVRYAKRCWDQFNAMTTWPDWGGTRHFLDAGIAAKAAAMAYDGLYDYLTADQRAKLVKAVRDFVLTPGMNLIERGVGPFRWNLSNDNWNGICHGGMIMAALAMYETDAAYMSRVIALCANGTLKYIQSLDPEGASEEGMSYWSYGLSNTFQAFESMKRVLSTTYGLTDNNGFRQTGWFPYYMSGPVGTATIGDDYIYSGKANKFLSYFWFANHFNDAALAKAHYDACMERNAATTIKMNGWLDLLYYSPQLVSQGSAASYPLFGHLEGIEYMYIHENFNSDQALYAGIHGGANDASHGHLDAGTFFIQALGETYAQGNLGAENPYPGDFFSNATPTYAASPTNSLGTIGRFSYYRVRTESKNCLVFNPDARPEQNPSGRATISKQGHDASGGYFVLDLSSCYSRDVSSYKRGMKMNRNTGIITIQDEFTPTRSSTVYWIMHSPATDGLQISSDGKTAAMNRNGKLYYAVIKSPSNATFTKIDRSETLPLYLPETVNIFSTAMANKNSANRWYGKLQIRLSGVNSATRIRVDFVKSASANTPAMADLDTWTSTN
jgi:hypothetical protein